MSKISLRTLLSSMLLLPLMTFAQGELNVPSDTLLWKAESLTDMVTDTTLANTSEFVTYNSAKITWTQTVDGTPTVFEFNVTDTDDHWSTNGYIAYTTSRKNKTQTFRFEQISGITKVTFSFMLPEGLRTLVFAIDEVSPLSEQP